LIPAKLGPFGLGVRSSAPVTTGSSVSMALPPGAPPPQGVMASALCSAASPVPGPGRSLEPRGSTVPFIGPLPLQDCQNTVR
jgi:hypothetical protein